MKQEIERKFLTLNDSFKQGIKPIEIRQGYLAVTEKSVTRIRTMDEKGFITIKEKKSGISRGEFEYEIPREEADLLLDQLCQKPLLEKNRYRVKLGSFTWDVDEFFGDNLGLTVAEIELESENQAFERPSWLGKEVSDDERYFNFQLIQNPFKNW